MYKTTKINWVVPNYERIFFFYLKERKKSLLKVTWFHRAGFSEPWSRTPSQVLCPCFISGKYDGQKGNSSGSQQVSSWKTKHNTAGLATGQQVSTLSPVEPLGSKDAWSERGAWSKAGPTEHKLQAWFLNSRSTPPGGHLTLLYPDPKSHVQSQAGFSVNGLTDLQLPKPVSWMLPSNCLLTTPTNDSHNINNLPTG